MITIVSGLPRSGTSLMMQMLEAGGMAVLVDEVRPPDDDNPRGYYEFEPVKSLETDRSWIAQSEGKAVKVVSQLLYHLPAQFGYKVLFIHRDLDEILLSQADMLERRGVHGGPPDSVMKGHFERHLKDLEKWLTRQSNMQVCDCRFRELIERPRAAISRVVAFLQRDLDQEAMTAVVDRSLCHHVCR